MEGSRLSINLRPPRFSHKPFGSCLEGTSFCLFHAWLQQQHLILAIQNLLIYVVFHLILLSEIGGGAQFSQARESKISVGGECKSQMKVGTPNETLCHFGKREILPTSRTKRNPGKAFYMCSSSNVLGIWGFRFTIFFSVPYNPGTFMKLFIVFAGWCWEFPVLCLGWWMGWI